MSDVPVIELIRPMPGCPDRRFALVELVETSLLCSLSSLEDPALRFLVVPPTVFFPDYAPQLDDAVVDELSINSVEQVMVLLVINPGESLHATTANLRAPVILNTANRRACQVILDDVDLPVRVPLLA